MKTPTCIINILMIKLLSFIGSVFLNLPVWANFYDLTDLSTYDDDDDFRQTSYIGLTQPKPQPKPG